LLEKEKLKRKLWAETTPFEDLAIEVFRYQMLYCRPYRLYVQYLGVAVEAVQHWQQIPFLPIQFFKSQQIISSQSTVQVAYKSSGTTAGLSSTHLVADELFYFENAKNIFELQFGKLSNYHILAPLPSYLEQGHSSLLAMLQYFMQATGSPHSQFYGSNYRQFLSNLESLATHKSTDSKILVWGVAYALLDILELATEGFFDAYNILLIETGGMKGRRAEMPKEVLQAILKKGYLVPEVGSEYGMTELLSQCYSMGNGVFAESPPMRIRLREPSDPFCFLPAGSAKTGGINVIDLANIESCAFIETQDLGQYAGTGQFRLMGRFDQADVRGCNLLVN
jgi:hypothetical protein